MSELVMTEDHGRVRHVVLNRPEKRNAFNAELIAALARALRAAAADPDVHVVVLRGAGPMFSSGVDLTELASMAGGPEHLRPFRRLWLDVATLLEEMPKATVCEIHGGCIGVGGASRLPQVVGLGRAKELIMTGRLIDGTEAERIGLVNRVAPAAELSAATAALVDELLLCAPVAVGLAKRAMDASARPALSTTLELEVALQEVCARTADFREAASAFVQKRPPAFTGR